METKMKKERNRIYHLYWEKRLSQAAIAREFEMSQSAIYLKMKKYGIKRRTRAEAEHGKYNPFFGRKHTEETKKIIASKNSHSNKIAIILNENERGIMDGLLLGDGHIDSNGSSGRYTQGCKYLEFLQHVQEKLPLEWSPIWHDPKWNCYHMKSHFNPTLKEVRNRWYPEGKKIVPKDLRISRECVLYWFLGDGTTEFANKRKFENSTYFRIRLSTDGFTQKDNQLLISKLDKKEIKAKLRQNRIHILAESREKFFKLIGESPVDCYKYKFKETWQKEHS